MTSASAQKKVVILTQTHDAHSDVITEELRRRHVPVLRFDQSDYPTSVSLSTTMGSGEATEGFITHQDTRTAFSDIAALWRRRPSFYTVTSNGVTPGEKYFLEKEASQGIEGLFDAHLFSISKMQAIRASSNKVVQLQKAQSCGLMIPRTLLTNDPATVLPFYKTCDRKMITKPVHSGFIEDDPNNKRLIFTNIVTQEHLATSFLTGVGTTTHLFQEALDKAFDLRVVVIGRHLFAIEIHTPAGNHDFRTAYADATYHNHQLPSDLSSKLLALVKSFDLQFSSMDLIVTKNGTYVWIELNPNGQFYWMQYQLALHGEHCPLKETMADLLSDPEAHQL